MDDVKRDYDDMLYTGALEELYPNLTGVWEEDEKEFRLIWDIHLSPIEDFSEEDLY